MLKLYQIFCAIWYHLYNLKNVKNTHGGMLGKVARLHFSWKYNLRSNVNSDLSIVTIF